MITDVPGVRVGHWTDPDGATGCTVVLCPEGSVAGVDVRGGAPGTIGTDSLQPGTPIGNTTLVCVGTNARLTKATAQRLTYVAHDGVALAVRPAHTHWDGDTVFTFGTGDVEPDWLRLPDMTAEVVAGVIRQGVRAAEGVPGFPAVGEGS